MATSAKAFLIELYEEYLEEASFLYEQRRTLFHNPEITWKKIGEFEERLEAHIDGLIVGEQLALEICARHAAEADFGELYAAVCVFCRQDQRDLVLARFDQLDPDDTEKADALTDALKHELPNAWIPDLLMLLDRGDPKLAPILARAFGYRRVESGPELLNAVRRCPGASLPDLIWALGRLKYAPAKELLFNYLYSETDDVRSAAAIALTRMGERRSLDHCEDQLRSSTWPILPLAFAGGRSSLALLTELAQKNGSADCLIALGLLGDPTSVSFLISALQQPETAAHAALALHAITGAVLFETTFVPDAVEEDELFDSEREEFKEGKVPMRGDSRPFGSNVTRISQNPEDWNRWWQANGSRFTPGLRYRNGGTFSPARLGEMLEADKTPYLLRRYCCEELATRYGHDVGFEVDSPVRYQTAKLAELAIWNGSNASRFREGDWYFAGSHQQ